jgi:SAM-dependent methyltransferase
LKRHSVRTGGSVLDYGCGDGLLIEYLAQQGFPETAGYDAYSERFNDPAVLGRQYDLVIAQDVIEHVEDPVALFQQLLDCTKPGGVICLGTPRADDIDLSNVERSIYSLLQVQTLSVEGEHKGKADAPAPGKTGCDLGNAQMCSDVAAASTAVSLRPSHDTLLMSMVSVRRYTPVNSMP